MVMIIAHAQLHIHTNMCKFQSNTCNKRTMMVLYRSPECQAVKVNNPMFQLVTPGAGQVLTPGHQMNKLGRGPLGYATYKISKL